MSKIVIKLNKICNIYNDNEKININDKIQDINIDEIDFDKIKECYLIKCNNFNILDKFNNLKYLELEDCNDVIIPDNLNTLTKLKSHWTNITILNNETKIEDLELCFMDNIILPDNMTSLKSLQIIECLKNIKLPDNMLNLENLHIINSNIKYLPNNLINLKYLFLWETYYIEYISKNYKNLKFVNVDENVYIPKEIKNNALYVRYLKNDRTYIIKNDLLKNNSLIDYKSDNYLKDFDYDNDIYNFIKYH